MIRSYARWSRYAAWFLFSLSSVAWSADTLPTSAEIQHLVQIGDLKNALTQVELYLNQKPRDPQMRFLKGVIQTEQGNTSQAINTFLKLTEDYPELPEPYNNLAVLYAGQNQLDKARAALEMAIRTNPSYATAHENLGDIYAKLASQAYSKALQLDSSNSAVVQPKLALIRDLFSPNAASISNGRTAAAALTAQSIGATSKTVASAEPSKSKPVPVTTTSTTTSSAASVTTRSAPISVSPPVTKTASVPAETDDETPSARVTSRHSDEEQSIKDAVFSWAHAWERKDMNAYFAAYAKDFDTGRLSRSEWEDQRQSRIANKSHIEIRIERLSVEVSGNKAQVRFVQSYRADHFSAHGRKVLEMVKKGGRWLITKEGID